MAAAKRELTMQDVGAIMARSAQSADPKEVYRAVERMAADTIGWRLFTVLRYVEAAQAVERVYSSDEKAYPVGGRKPLDKITASHGAMERGEVFLAATKEDVREGGLSRGRAHGRRHDRMAALHGAALRRGRASRRARLLQRREGLPVGGRKPLDKITASHGAMERGEVFLAATKEDVRKAFFDHELIFSLGITAILNVPIRHAGRRLGTINLCGEEGMYGPAEIARGKILAGLLAAPLLPAVG